MSKKSKAQLLLENQLALIQVIDSMVTVFNDINTGVQVPGRVINSMCLQVARLLKSVQDQLGSETKADETGNGTQVGGAGSP
jgi:hypothetical protein